MRPAIRVAACIIATLAPLASARAEPAFELTGKGVQIYVCTHSSNGYDWTLKAPDARLLDAQGNDVGHHFAGPSWQGKDGSLVTGESEYTASGTPGSVAWLVLRAKTHSGQGMFATVKAIVRTRTLGGAAPAEGCDAAHANTETQVPYSASYSFFPG